MKELNKISNLGRSLNNDQVLSNQIHNLGVEPHLMNYRITCNILNNLCKLVHLDKQRRWKKNCQWWNDILQDIHPFLSFPE